MTITGRVITAMVITLRGSSLIWSSPGVGGVSVGQALGVGQALFILGMTDRVMTVRVMTDRVMTDWVITERVITERVITERAMTDWVNTNWDITDRVMTD